MGKKVTKRGKKILIFPESGDIIVVMELIGQYERKVKREKNVEKLAA